ncbi:MAG: carbohydrate ABC transporter permease [Anaerolineae bacterium]|nr:carbohydrate ABC transporter permease [Anaerolineae bacterium]MDW8067739.1 carbohydrate ABC transporter permease [Anaerolineae bacterium]
MSYRRLSHYACKGLRIALAYLLAGTVTFLFLLPLLWMISSSLKPDYQVLEFPPRWFPTPVQWSNYPKALTYVPFGRYILNTLFISMMVIVGHILSCVIVAYGFARLRAPGKDLLFLVLLATMMLPYPVTMIPLYIGFKTVGWVNSFWPLIVPAFFGSPFYIFLLRQFFLTIPPDLEDAARIDGANLLQILWHVLLPNLKPAIATVVVFSFQASWNDFLPPLIYLHDQSKYVVSLGLSFFRSSYDIRWNYLMAASLVTILPVVIVFFLTQRLVLKSIALTGVKA